MLLVSLSKISRQWQPWLSAIKASAYATLFLWGLAEWGSNRMTEANPNPWWSNPRRGTWWWARSGSWNAVKPWSPPPRRPNVGAPMDQGVMMKSLIWAWVRRTGLAQILKRCKSKLSLRKSRSVMGFMRVRYSFRRRLVRFRFLGFWQAQQG